MLAAIVFFFFFVRMCMYVLCVCLGFPGEVRTSTCWMAAATTLKAASLRWPCAARHARMEARQA